MPDHKNPMPPMPRGGYDSEEECDAAIEAIDRQMAEATREKYEKLPVTRGVLHRFPRALLYLAAISKYGTEKHEVPIDDNSYKDIPDAQGVYTDAMGRHLLAEAIHGQVNAEDGNLFHMGQASWDSLARLEIYLQEIGWTGVPS